MPLPNVNPVICANSRFLLFHLEIRIIISIFAEIFENTKYDFNCT